MLNLDTHIVVALLSGDLSASERELILNEPLAISGIVLWELAKLAELKRLELDMDSAEFREFLRSVPLLTRDRRILKSKVVPLARP